MYCKDRLLQLDLVVIILSIISDVFLGDAKGHLLIMLRLWRMIRVSHGMFAVHSDEKAIKEAKEKEKLAAEERAILIQTLKVAHRHMGGLHGHAKIVAIIHKVLVLSADETQSDTFHSVADAMAVPAAYVARANPMV